MGVGRIGMARFCLTQWITLPDLTAKYLQISTNISCFGAQKIFFAVKSKFFEEQEDEGGERCNDFHLLVQIQPTPNTLLDHFLLQNQNDEEN